MASRLSTLLLAIALACLAAIAAPSGNAARADRQTAIVFELRDHEQDRQIADEAAGPPIALNPTVLLPATPARADVASAVHPALFQRPPPSFCL